MRLIDADVLKRKAQKEATEAWKMKITAKVETILNQFIDWVEEAPTVEPERKLGHWIIYILSMFDGEDCKCSECGQISCAPYWHYCPNCGAKMEGCEQDETD